MIFRLRQTYHLRYLMYGAALILVMGIFIPEQGSCQKSKPVSSINQRDSQALTALNDAISALGGTQLLRGGGSIAIGSETQGTETSQFIWKNSGEEFRYETTGSTGQPTIIVSGHGSPRASQQGQEVALPAEVRETDIPFLLTAYKLASLISDSNVSLTYLGMQTLNGNPSTAIRTWNTADQLVSRITLETWYFDPHSRLPIAVEYFAPNLARRGEGSYVTTYFSDYKEQNGMQIPFAVETQMDGMSPVRITIQSIAFDQDIEVSQFDLK
jgi:hypothetical protein